ncbi:MAG: DUF1890 domain-containing protein [Methanoregula sp.]|nr:DUF1890 domain-containing protein [Methanoregula sp.]
MYKNRGLIDLADEVKSQRSALLVLGCPQVPVQTSIALYLIHRLRQAGISPVVAGNRSAVTLLVVADPKRHYLGEALDLDRAIDQITEKKRDFDLCFVFIHNDAGVSYAATMGAISKARLYAIIYGEHYDKIVSSIEFPCINIAANAVHNPMPLKKMLDEVAPWAV